MSNLAKTDGIRRILPLKCFVVWRGDKNYFFRPNLNKSNCILLSGIWRSEEEAIKDIGFNEYKVIEIDFSNKIPQDIVRIMNMDNDAWGIDVKKRMIKSKFIQLMETFVFRDEKLRESLNNG